MDKKKLRELAMAATPGPWTHCGASDGKCPCGLIWAGHGNDTVARSYSAEHEDGGRHQDAAFIAEANPSTILALLDENDSLRAEVERLRASAGAHDEALRYLAYWKGNDQHQSNAEEIAVGNMVIGEDGEAIGKDGGNG